MPQIADALVDLNPWWKGPFAVEYRDREVYLELEAFLRMRHIVALVGLRRVGKTTLLLKIAQDAMRAGTDPRRVLYFSFDEHRASSLRDLLHAYEDLHKVDRRQGNYLILLDEVQKLARWEDQLKVLYDLHPRMKFVVSGSESLFLRRGTREFLGGRIFEFTVRPLSFREFLGFKRIAHHPLELYRRELSRALDAFIPTLGFPELLGNAERPVVRRYIRENVVEKVIYRDLPGVLKIKDPAVLESIMNILMNEPGQLFDTSSLAGELGVSRQTVSKYLWYLEQAFLLRKLYNYSTGRRKVERKLKKYYPSILSPELLFRQDDDARSRVLEWLVVNQLKAEYFWRDPYQKEVDIILPRKRPLPVEVKYGRVDTSGVSAFMRKHKVSRGVVVSREAQERRWVEGGRVEVVPAYEFLLREFREG